MGFKTLTCFWKSTEKHGIYSKEHCYYKNNTRLIMYNANLLNITLFTLFKFIQYKMNRPKSRIKFFFKVPYVLISWWFEVVENCWNHFIIHVIQNQKWLLLNNWHNTYVNYLLKYIEHQVKHKVNIENMHSEKILPSDEICVKVMVL